MIIRCVPDWEAILRWETFRPLVQKALDRSQGEYASDDIRDAVNQGKMQLWILDEGDSVPALAVTQILTYPQKRYCEIVLAATSRRMGVRFWRGAIRLVGAFSKHHGCDKFRVFGRKGWGRAMGWKEIYAVFEKQI